MLGIHVLDSAALRSNSKYIIGGVLNGGLDMEMLKRRREQGLIVNIEKGQYKMLAGKEARSLREELMQRLEGASQEAIISGTVASQGYAKGIARVVLDQKDFHKFKEGEILITGMTRPEFVPLMQKAAAIVTNEGGITSHAAIISRELGKPCIIGTKLATQLINDGDLIEVRAHHGTVRILERHRA